MSASDQERYVAAMHGVQSGVMFEHANGSDDGTPKHLRVGINSAMVNDEALTKLLIARGVFTEEEYVAAVADAAEAELARYNARAPKGVTFR